MALPDALPFCGKSGLPGEASMGVRGAELVGLLFLPSNPPAEYVVAATRKRAAMSLVDFFFPGFPLLSSSGIGGGVGVNGESDRPIFRARGVINGGGAFGFCGTFGTVASTWSIDDAVVRMLLWSSIEGPRADSARGTLFTLVPDLVDESEGLLLSLPMVFADPVLSWDSVFGSRGLAGDRFAADCMFRSEGFGGRVMYSSLLRMLGVLCCARRGL